MTNDIQLGDEVTSGGGWTCGYCLQWVGPGESHVCPQPPQPEIETFDFSWSMEKDTDLRIVTALERIADALEKIVKRN